MSRAGSVFPQLDAEERGTFCEPTAGAVLWRTCPPGRAATGPRTGPLGGRQDEELHAGS
jgi:hypothetical protein